MTRAATPPMCFAGMDAAISDGADVLSLSFGDDHIKPFYQDTIAIGAFSAMQKGILVVCSAGNSGPDPGFLMNDAPWILTVGAGTMDRQMRAVVKLGNGQTFVGESAYQPHGLPPTQLVTPVQHNSSTPECQPLTGVAGKIVVIEDVCDDMVQTGTLVKDSGGAGMVLTGEEEDGNTAYTDAHVLPASYVTYQDGIAIRKYMKSTKIHEIHQEPGGCHHLPWHIIQRVLISSRRCFLVLSWSKPNHT